MQDLARIKQDRARQDGECIATSDVFDKLDCEVPLAAKSPATPSRFHASTVPSSCDISTAPRGGERESKGM